MLRFRHFHPAHLSVIACLALSPAAYAESAAEKPTAAQIKEAKRDAADAAKLMKKKQFSEALPKLQAAYDVDPKPATLAQIGTCQRELSQNAEAYATFERVLASDAKQLSAKDKKAAEKNLEELGKLTALLRVTVSEADAELSLNGNALASEALTKPIRLNPGVHKLLANKAGFEPFSKDVEVAAGAEATIEAKLVAEVKTARVRVTEKSGNEARVFVNGKDVGAAPWEGDLDPGQYIVELKGARVASQKQTIDLVAKQKVELDLDASIQQGRLKLTAIPAEATVVINGETASLPYEGDLDVGTHLVEISAPGYETASREIVVTPDQATEESFALAPVAAEGEPSERFVKPGVLLAAGFPRPSGEVVVKLGDYIGVGAQYSMLPNITFPLVDAKLETSAIQGTLRAFPFGGSFYVGIGGGVQMLKASMSEGDLMAETDLSSPVITPQIGWLWVWDSGFTLGLSLGAQIPFGSEPDADVKYNGVSVSQVAGIEQATLDRGNALKGKVNDAAKLVGKTPLPQIDFIKIGFFF